MDLRDKLRKIDAIIDRSTNDGEIQAAEFARQRLLKKIVEEIDEKALQDRGDAKVGRKEERHYVFKDHPDMQKLEDLWYHVKTHKTNEKTFLFVQSLRSYLKKHGRLSVKQFECMMKCYKFTCRVKT